MVLSGWQIGGDWMSAYVLAFLIGVPVGLRSMTPLARVKLGGSPRQASSGRHLAGLSGLRLHAVHFHGACDR